MSTLLLSTVHTDKSKVEISQNFVAFSDYMNFKRKTKHYCRLIIFLKSLGIEILTNGAVTAQWHDPLSLKIRFIISKVNRLQIHKMAQSSDTKDVFRGNDSFLSWMLAPPGFVILSSDKSSERNLSCFFDIIKPRRIEHLQSEEPSPQIRILVSN